MNHKQRKIVEQLISIRESNNLVLAACIYHNEQVKETSFLNVFLVIAGNRDYKGRYTIDGVTVDYKEKSFYTIMNEIEANEKNQNVFYHTLFEHYDVVFDQNNWFHFLNEYLYKVHLLPSPNTKLDRKDFEDLRRAKSEFEVHLKDSEDLSNYYYYLYLECLRQKYHKKNNFTNIHSSNVYKLYRNSQLAEFCCVSLPQEYYRSFYMDCIQKEHTFFAEKQQRVQNAFKYLDIEPLDKIHVTASLNHKSNLLVCKHQLIMLQQYKNQIEMAYQQGEPTKYTYSNFKQQLDQVMIASGIGPSITTYSNMNQTDIEKSISLLQEQLHLNPLEYEIPYYGKKYRNH